MSRGAIALIIVGSILLYGIGLGGTYALFVGGRKNVDELAAGMGSVFWPIVLPALLAYRFVVNVLMRPTPLPRAQIKKDK